MSTYWNIARLALPQELIYMVIDQLHDDKPTLSAFSSVSKSFFEHTRSHLFASITLRPAFRGASLGLQNLLHFLKNTSHAAKYIHHLFLDGRNRGWATLPSAHVGELLQVLALTTSLRRLRLRCLCISFSSESAVDVSDSHVPALQELTLEELFDERDIPFSFSVDWFSSLLSYFPSLSTLEIGRFHLQRTSNQIQRKIPPLKLTELRICFVTEPAYLLPFISGLEALSLDRVDILSATTLIEHISPTAKSLQFRAIFSASDSDVPHFSVLSNCHSLLTYTASSHLSDGVYQREEMWRALTGPLPYLPTTLRHFVFILITRADMHDFMSKPIAALEDRAGWDEHVQEGLLALASLETVEIVLDHDFEDEHNEYNVKYMKGCQVQLKAI